MRSSLRHLSLQSHPQVLPLHKCKWAIVLFFMGCTMVAQAQTSSHPVQRDLTTSPYARYLMAPPLTYSFSGGSDGPLIAKPFDRDDTAHEGGVIIGYDPGTGKTTTTYLPPITNTGHAHLQSASANTLLYSAVLEEYPSGDWFLDYPYLNSEVIDFLSPRDAANIRLDNIDIYPAESATHSLYAFISAPQVGFEAWRWVFGFSHADFVNELAVKTGEGFRITDIEFDRILGVFAGVWIDDGVDHTWALDLSQQGMIDRLNMENADNNRRPIDIQVYSYDRTEFVHGLVWEENTGNPFWNLAFNMPFSQFEPWLQGEINDGKRLIDLEIVQKPEGTFYYGITIGDGKPAGYVLNATSEGDFSTQIDLLASGDPRMRVTRIEVHNDVVIGTDIEESPATVAGYTLAQNFPNPVQQSTEIGFRLPVAGVATLEIFDMLGKKVAVLANEHLPAGIHQRTFEPGALATGLYMYRLSAEGYSMNKRLVVIR